jgi:hypothetical protein
MSRAPKRIRSFYGAGCLSIQPATSVFAAREDVDLVILHVSDGRGEAGVLLFAEPDEAGLVEPDGARLVQPFAVGLEQGLAVGGHGVVDRVPVTGEFGGHLGDRPAPADLDRGPLGGPGGQQAMLGRDAVVFEDPGPFRAGRVHTAHAVLLPGQRHRAAVDGKVHVVHHRAFFDLRACGTRRAKDRPSHLLDHQLDDRPAALVVKHHDVFEADEGRKDLSRVDEDEGASCFLAHNLKPEAPSPNSGGPRLPSSSPLKSEEPEVCLRVGRHLQQGEHSEAAGGTEPPYGLCRSPFGFYSRASQYIPPGHHLGMCAGVQGNPPVLWHHGGMRLAWRVDVRHLPADWTARGRPGDRLVTKPFACSRHHTVIPASWRVDVAMAIVDGGLKALSPRVSLRSVWDQEAQGLNVAESPWATVLPLA